MTPPRFALARLALVEAAAAVALVAARDAFTEPVTRLLWWCATAIATWLVVTTVAGAATCVFPALRALRLDVLTAPGVRRIVDGAFACSLVLGTPALAAGAASARTSPTTAAAPVVSIAPNGDVIVSPSTSVRTPTRATTTPPHRPSTGSCRGNERNPCAGATRTSGVGGLAAATTHVVVRGDNLWSIAAAHLGAHRAADVAPYWQRVVDANRATLRSGDPSLIYPGEHVTLPPLV
jgi:hypothetical protein